ncbi:MULTISPECIES: ornithine decarboxylase [Providencia]|uniref:ornithine decarboxylase n=1 Tax=Providencia TaxID=586 RepID=UPI0019D0B0D4|nr:MULTISPECIES: ornithine decarboxylase [Providencia]MBN6359831.1 ornithine decarboxylase [Providencia huaxiensis]MCD2529493.1 ornithine decarboxylase [Providencia huaxiensis]
MNKINVACSQGVAIYFTNQFQWVDIRDAQLNNIAAVVLSEQDANQGLWERVVESQLSIPLFIISDKQLPTDGNLPPYLTALLPPAPAAREENSRQLLDAADQYLEQLLPPFFARMMDYAAGHNVTFACPGHQGGQFFRRHPTGEQFYQFYGENLFRTDLCNADVAMGDLLIHEGAAKEAQKFAAKVFNADKTYFVLNGTSSSNKVVLNALLTPGDLVLFDRNNHKSNHHGALIQAGATPVYLETARNPFGFIGGIDAHCFGESYLRELIQEVMPEKAQAKRPFRLAVIQLGTYDGTVYNARQVVDKIGHLCDYILFDSAWVGYEQFIPMMRQCSPLLLELNENDPGIMVTQSVHKQLAGFSQASQIHKKDNHIKGQERFVSHKKLNNAFMMHASTSPFYPLFASLDVNARIHQGDAGKMMWMDCVKVGIEVRKSIFQHCRYFKPFVPEVVDGKAWHEYPTEQIAAQQRFFNFIPQERWHAFDGYAQDQYFVDPCKLMLTTPGIDVESGEYETFGVPATILAHFLREHGVIPEKCDLNSILFLLTPAETREKLELLVSHLVRFEQLLDEDALLEEVLPSVYQRYQAHYQGYTLRRLCQEMHQLSVNDNIKQLQKEMFRKNHFPEVKMAPQQAHLEFIRGNCELLPLDELEGRIAVEGALPYPPGVLCVVPGEVWSGPVLRYFKALETGINALPGFAPELQGVYISKNEGEKKRVYAHVLK